MSDDKRTRARARDSRLSATDADRIAVVIDRLRNGEITEEMILASAGLGNDVAEEIVGKIPVPQKLSLDRLILLLPPGAFWQVVKKSIDKHSKLAHAQEMASAIAVSKSRSDINHVYAINIWLFDALGLEHKETQRLVNVLSDMLIGD